MTATARDSVGDLKMHALCISASARALAVHMKCAELPSVLVRRSAMLRFFCWDSQDFVGGEQHHPNHITNLFAYRCVVAEVVSVATETTACKM